MTNNGPCTGNTALRLTPLMLFCALLINPVYVFCGNMETPLLSVDAGGMSFSRLLEKIADDTGYQIELAGAWPDTRLYSQLDGMQLEDGLKRIIKELGTSNYFLSITPENKYVKLSLIQNVTGTAPDLTSQEVRVIKSVAPDVIADIEGAPGVIGSRPDGSKEISPPSIYGPGLTSSELDKIKNNHKFALEQQDVNTALTPSSDRGGPITLGALSRIKREHQETRASIAQDTIISPSSKEGRGITVAELQTIKEQHAARVVTGNTEISPPSSDGPGLTLDEINAIKKQHRDERSAHRRE